MKRKNKKEKDNLKKNPPQNLAELAVQARFSRKLSQRNSSK